MSRLRASSAYAPHGPLVTTTMAGPALIHSRMTSSTGLPG